MPNPIYPDVRFGAAFLDKKYKTFAELGEVVMDKISGELFLKRKQDGKLISFVQNNKYLHDIMIELRILMKNHISFTYPTTETSWFASSDFNVEDIMGVTNNIINGGILEFSDARLDETKRIEFNISTKSNGFFVRPISRDTDKNIIEYLTNLYNSTFSNYTGTNITYLAEYEKFVNDETWYHTNATITYSFQVTGTSGGEELIETYSDTANIKINEETFVEVPDDYKLMFDTVDNIKVTVKMVTVNKFEMIQNYIASNVDFDLSVYNDMIAPDSSVVIDHINIMAFADDISGIPANVNVVNVALIDTPYLLRYMTKIDKLSVAGGYIPSITRPEDGIWTVNNIWAEIITNINGNGVVNETNHETNIEELEDFIYVTEGIVTNFTMNPDDSTDILIDDLADNTEETV